MTEANKQDEPGLGGFPTAGGIEPGVLDAKIEKERQRSDDDMSEQGDRSEQGDLSEQDDRSERHEQGD